VSTGVPVICADDLEIEAINPIMTMANWSMVIKKEVCYEHFHFKQSANTSFDSCRIT
jgi:hypothetical protein